MKPPRDIIKHVDIETAQRKRNCSRSRKHEIIGGDICIVIQEGAFSGSKNYCVECGLEILKAAEVRLASLRSTLESY
jgi:hypothetical protein